MYLVKLSLETSYLYRHTKTFSMSIINMFLNKLICRKAPSNKKFILYRILNFGKKNSLLYILQTKNLYAILKYNVFKYIESLNCVYIKVLFKECSKI